MRTPWARGKHWDEERDLEIRADKLGRDRMKQHNRDDDHELADTTAVLPSTPRESDCVSGCHWPHGSQKAVRDIYKMSVVEWDEEFNSLLHPLVLPLTISGTTTS